MTPVDQSALDANAETIPAKRRRKGVEVAASQNAMRNFLGITKSSQSIEDAHTRPVKEKKRSGRPKKQARLGLDDEGLEVEVEELNQFGSEVATGMEGGQPSQPSVVNVVAEKAIFDAPSGKDLEVSEEESKQLLKLDGFGGFGLLTQSKQVDIIDAPAQDQAKPKRSRKRKRAIVLRYGRTALSDRIRIGKQINYILCQPQAAVPVMLGEPEPKASPRRTRAKVDKKSHPFFTGKAKRSRGMTPPPKSSCNTQVLPSPFKSFTTPGKMRSQMQASQVAIAASVPTRINVPSRIFSLPGTQHAAWPTKENMHVRSIPKEQLNLVKQSTYRPRKRKSKTIVLGSILPYIPNNTSSQTTLLRPKRLLSSGQRVQQTVSSQLRTDFHNFPALARLHKSLLGSLTPFDVGSYESQLWTQKYAPRSAVEVLQAGQEAFELKHWLESQTTAHARAQKSRTKDEEKETRKKKRKLKQEGLGGFVVDSDDDSQVDPCIPNTILLSGPSGSGKTAAVYAVAKELGFDVFEIGPNSRRSGKDILDKVGDMSLNHQVRRAERASSITNSVDGNTSELDFTLPAEPDASQSTLTSFFGGGLKKPKKSTPGMKSNKKQEEQMCQLKVLKERASSQKQSLILIEEADILFDEDKQFWETVITLSTQSKRPIIITCNNENLIPEDELSLHGVLRWHQPSRDLVTDYLLLIAAAEGHLLERQAIEALYKSRDLRGALSDLQFWCQMAVGDPRGGIDWYLQRWPSGVDKDTEGQSLRVLSSGTFHSALLEVHNSNDAEEQLSLIHI